MILITQVITIRLYVGVENGEGHYLMRLPMSHVNNSSFTLCMGTKEEQYVKRDTYVLKLYEKAITYGMENRWIQDFGKGSSCAFAHTELTFFSILYPKGSGRVRSGGGGGGKTFPNPRLPTLQSQFTGIGGTRKGHNDPDLIRPFDIPV